MTNGVKQNNNKNLTWWKRRSAKERGQTIITVCTVILCIALALGIGIVVVNFNSCNVKNNEAVPAKTEMLPLAGALIALQQDQSLSSFIRGSDSVCTTPACVHAASMLLAKMDMNVEPCDDFYRFACGGFLKEPVEPDTMFSNSYTALEEKIFKQLRITLEESSTLQEPKPFKMAKNLYKSCMNHTVREAQGLDPLREFLKKHGGWPVLMGTRWNDTSFSWTQFTNSMGESRNEKCPADIFLKFYIDVDDENSTARVLHLGQRSVIAREYLNKGLKDEKIMALHSFMVDIAVMLGANRQVAKEELLSVLEFEIKLSNVSLQNELRNSTRLSNRMTIRQLSEEYPSIPWKAYLSRLLPPSIQVDDNEVIIVAAPSFITSLEKLINDTPKRIQANYVMWNLALPYLTALNDNVRERVVQLATANGMIEKLPRWMECVKSVHDNLIASVTAQFVRKYVDEEAKKNVSEMVDNIRAQFYKILQEANWLDDDTRKSALAKATSMTSLIAYHDELLDDSMRIMLIMSLHSAASFHSLNPSVSTTSLI